MNSLKPFFSVVIPALNEEEYLPDLLKDLSWQTFKDFEVVVVDGKSEDKTVARASKFKSILPQLILVHSKKRNVSYQRNLGAKKARGEWILFMDADNRLPHYFLEGVKYRIHLTRAEVFTCWCEVDSKKPADLAVGSIINIIFEIGAAIDFQLSYGSLIGIKKKFFENLGGFDPKIVFAEDSNFVRRAAKKGYRFEVFKDPRFTHSLRRFRKEGTLNTIRRTAKMHLKNLAKIPIDQKKEYPMGGDKFFKKLDK